MLFEKVASIPHAIQGKVVLYGWRSTILIVAKALLLKFFGVSWQKCYLMSRLLAGIHFPGERKDIEIRELVLSDYDNKLWKDFLTDEKRAVYETRFKNGRAKAYGAFMNGVLAYSTWILYGEVIYSETETLLHQKDCALLLDTYCSPKFRGMGIHNYMNHWSLWKMKEHGMKKAYGIVLSYNRPAIKTQEKCGMQIEKTFYAFRILGNNYTTFKRIY